MENTIALLATTTVKKSFDFDELLQALNPGGGTQLNIYGDTLTEAFADFLDEYYFWQDRTIQIDAVEMTLDEASRTLSFTGKYSGCSHDMMYLCNLLIIRCILFSCRGGNPKYGLFYLKLLHLLDKITYFSSKSRVFSTLKCLGNCEIHHVVASPNPAT